MPKHEEPTLPSLPPLPPDSAPELEPSPDPTQKHVITLSGQRVFTFDPREWPTIANVYERDDRGRCCRIQVRGHADQTRLVYGARDASQSPPWLARIECAALVATTGLPSEALLYNARTVQEIRRVGDAIGASGGMVREMCRFFGVP